MNVKSDITNILSCYFKMVKRFVLRYFFNNETFTVTYYLTCENFYKKTPVPIDTLWGAHTLKQFTKFLILVK